MEKTAVLIAGPLENGGASNEAMFAAKQAELRAAGMDPWTPYEYIETHKTEGRAYAMALSVLTRGDIGQVRLIGDWRHDKRSLLLLQVAVACGVECADEGGEQLKVFSNLNATDVGSVDGIADDKGTLRIPLSELPKCGPIPGIPRIRVLDVQGHAVAEGYYAFHVNRSPAPMGDCIRPRDCDHVLVTHSFADWNMPQQILCQRVCDDGGGGWVEVVREGAQPQHVDAF